MAILDGKKRSCDQEAADVDAAPKENASRETTTENCSESSKKVEDGGPKYTHTHLDGDEPVRFRLCPLSRDGCKLGSCAWFSFDDDECAVVALVKVLESLLDWETSRS